MTKNLDLFFNPKSVAIIGASRNPQKIGHIVLKNFVEEGFAGKVFPVNPDADQILNLKSYPTVKDIHDDVDAAVILTPADVIAKILKDCGEKKIRAVTIISSGFKEIGSRGEKIESELKKIIEKYKINVIGPNCLGIFDTTSQVDMLFLPAYRLGRPQKGTIAFITQSGAFGSVILDWAAQEGFGISKFISYGNAIDIDEIDFLEYLGNDQETKVITVYLEGANRARELIEIGKKVSKIKPILCLKAGGSKRGAAATQSHTGSLAGSDEIYSAAFKQAGIIRVQTIEEMFDYARALATQPLMKGNRIAIITDGGGFGVMATDYAEQEGLIVEEVSEQTKKKMMKCTLPFATLHNPIDLTGSASSAMYRCALEATMADKNIDALLVILLFQPPNIESDVIAHLLEVKSKYQKPMLVCSAGGNYTQLHRDILERSGIPTYPTPDRAIKSLAILYKYTQIKAKQH
ncbi:TPA: CoA-binding protein [archaeon]|uniref:CoA-binding protein n=1 Tax=Candidatus Naiadarchaeum limnaeum TaxID=2756139 RepID=A0A832V537_9ARCH|nr:CoA-binding protein [Candidatus Naiadarchaeales archaeon SRR2090153.bin1042]HIK00420.1 CoA-binding protein [Candidatus Naiadarchaeum limnaeum]